MSFMSSLKVAKHYYDKGRSGPVMFDLHPTLACQNKCSFCISANFHVGGVERSNFDRKHQLDWDVLRRVIHEWDNMNVRSVQLTGGGEPTLYSHFADLLYELKRANIKIGLITNGIKVHEYSSEILDTVDWMRFSLDASNKDMYRRIKNTEHFDEVMSSIYKITSERKDHVRAKKVRIGVAYIITHESMSGIDEIVNSFEQEGTAIDYLQFKDVVMRGMTLTPYYHQMIEKAIEQAEHEAHFPVMYTKHGGIQADLEGMTECDVLDYVAILGADGNVYPCCSLEYIPAVSYGSVYDHSISTIWEKRPPFKIREELCWNCRFTGINKIIRELNELQDSDFL